MLREVLALGGLVEDGVVDGVHLEGPWLSTLQCGAHDPALLRAPAADEVERLVGHPAVRMVTIAPELPDAIDAVRRITGLGAVAAVGHTDADLAQTRAAIAAGATQATHLFNAMRPLRHRDPGAVLALLEDPGVALEVIRDGVHLDPDVCRWLDATLAPDRLVAVTDAMAAAGAGDGDYPLGGLGVEVADGVARVAGTDTIAGSTATMDRLFRSAAGDRDDVGLAAGGPADVDEPGTRAVVRRPWSAGAGGTSGPRGAVTGHARGGAGDARGRVGHDFVTTAADA